MRVSTSSVFAAFGATDVLLSNKILSIAAAVVVDTAAALDPDDWVNVPVAVDIQASFLKSNRPCILCIASACTSPKYRLAPSGSTLPALSSPRNA